MSMNRTIQSGRFVADPKVDKLPSGTAVANFVIAVNEVFSVKGERKEHTSFLEVKAYGHLAELMEKYFTKGRMILVEGRLRQEKWQDKDGNNRSKVVIKMEDFSFMDSKKKEDGENKEELVGTAVGNQDTPF